MSPALSLFCRELLALPRRKRFYLKRAGFVAAGAVVILGGMIIGLIFRSTTTGLEIFVSLSVATLFLMAVIAPNLASSLIMREKEERTLGLLFLTDISGWGFVFAKLLTGVFSTIMTILSVLPMFMLAVSLGGVSAGQILTAFLIILSTVFLGTCAGLFAAAASKTEKTMNASLGFLWLGYLMAVPVLTGVIYASLRQWEEPPPGDLMCVVSPFASMFNLVGGRSQWPCLVNSCINLIFGIPFLWLTRAIMPNAVVTADTPSFSERMKERLKSLKRLKRWTVPPEIKGNPVLWKDCHFWHGGWRSSWFKFWASTLLLCIIFIVVTVKGAFSVEDMINALVFGLLIVSALIVGASGVNKCGATFYREKKARTLELLLTTDLSDSELILGKVQAIVLSLLPWFICAGLCGLGVVFMYGAEDNFRNVCSILVMEYASMLFGYSFLALWLSLRLRKNVAFGICTIVFILWNYCGRGLLMIVADFFLTLDTGFVVFLVSVDVAAHVGMGLVFRSLVFNSFRTLALRDTA